MKLQWLPKPNSSGGWDQREYFGFDRLGDIAAKIKEVRGAGDYEWSCHWEVNGSDAHYTNKDEAILAAESSLPEPF